MKILELIIDAFAAIGTVGATLLALYLAQQGKKRRIDSVFVWGAPTDYAPVLLVQNVGDRSCVLDHICIYYRGELISDLSFFEENLLREFAVILAEETKRISIKSDYFKVDKPNNPKRKYTLKIKVIPRQGKCSVSKYKYSYNELFGLLFGSRIWGTDGGPK